jgi:hypothetical protein
LLDGVHRRQSHLDGRWSLTAALGQHRDRAAPALGDGAAPLDGPDDLRDSALRAQVQDQDDDSRDDHQQVEADRKITHDGDLARAPGHEQSEARQWTRDDLLPRQPVYVTLGGVPTL